MARTRCVPPTRTPARRTRTSSRSRRTHRPPRRAPRYSHCREGTATARGHLHPHPTAPTPTDVVANRWARGEAAAPRQRPLADTAMPPGDMVAQQTGGTTAQGGSRGVDHSAAEAPNASLHFPARRQRRDADARSRRAYRVSGRSSMATWGTAGCRRRARRRLRRPMSRVCCTVPPLVAGSATASAVAASTRRLRPRRPLPPSPTPPPPPPPPPPQAARCGRLGRMAVAPAAFSSGRGGTAHAAGL